MEEDIKGKKMLRSVVYRGRRTGGIWGREAGIEEWLEGKQESQGREKDEEGDER